MGLIWVVLVVAQIPEGLKNILLDSCLVGVSEEEGAGVSDFSIPDFAFPVDGVLFEELFQIVHDVPEVEVVIQQPT